MLWYILLFLGAVTALILFTPITITASYNGEEFGVKLQLLFIKLNIMKLIENKAKGSKLKKKGPKKEKKKKEKPKKSLRENIDDVMGKLDLFFSPALSAADAVRKRLRFPDVTFNLSFGLDDPASTAIAHGYACAVIFPFFSLVQRKLRVEDFRVRINPLFDKKGFDISFFCSVRFHLFIFVLAGGIFMVKVIKKWISRYKNRRKLQTS